MREILDCYLVTSDARTTNAFPSRNVDRASATSGYRRIGDTRSHIDISRSAQFSRADRRSTFINESTDVFLGPYFRTIVRRSFRVSLILKCGSADADSVRRVGTHARPGVWD